MWNTEATHCHLQSNLVKMRRVVGLISGSTRCLLCIAMGQALCRLKHLQEGGDCSTHSKRGHQTATGLSAGLPMVWCLSAGCTPGQTRTEPRCSASHQGSGQISGCARDYQHNPGSACRTEYRMQVCDAFQDAGCTTRVHHHAVPKFFRCAPYEHAI